MKTAVNTNKQYLKDLLILAFPLFIGSLGHTLLGAADTLIVAKYSIKSLAALSIANSLIFTIMIIGIGILTAVSIILSNIRGTKQRIKKYLPSVLALSLFLSVLFAAICYLTNFCIPYMKFEQQIVPMIQEYITIVSVSMFGVFLFEGMRQFLQSYEIVKLPNFIVLASVVLNVIADIIFVFGFGVIPPMGSTGAAIATLFVRFFMAIVLFVYIFKFINFKTEIDFSLIKKIVKTGWPIGFALLFEFLAFNIITILAGQEATVLAAIHSILITISSATFMIPFAVSTALSVKVAYFFGANKPLEIKNYVKTATYTVLGFMSVISIILSLFPDEIMSIFTNDANVLDIAFPLIFIVAAYQIFDGFQTVMGGVLKGFKLTKTVSATVFAGYWFIGAPVAYFLETKFNMSLRGYWIALAVSLCIMGLVQAVIANYYYKRLFTKS